MSQKNVKGIKRAIRRKETKIARGILIYICTKPLWYRIRFAINIIARRYR